MKAKVFFGMVVLFGTTVAYGQQISATVNGTSVQFPDVQPIERDGRVLVPVRGVFEQMGVNVDWEPASQAVYATGNGRSVTLYINKRTARVDDRDVPLDVPAILYAGRTMVPLRFISESMGAMVDWIPSTNTVAISTALASQPEHYPGQQPRYRDRRPREDRGSRPQPIGRSIVLAANTVIPVTLNDRLSSRDSTVGDTFTATVDTRGNDNYLGLPDGTKVEGHVSAVRARSGSTPGVLGLAFDRLRFPDGRAKQIDASLIGLDTESVDNRDGRLVAKSSDHRDDKYIGVGAGVGALVAVVTKGNVISSAVIGAALGYLYDQQRSTSNRHDVTLTTGSHFGVALNRDETIPIP